MGKRLRLGNNIKQYLSLVKQQNSYALATLNIYSLHRSTAAIDKSRITFMKGLVIFPSFQAACHASKHFAIFPLFFSSFICTAQLHTKTWWRLVYFSTATCRIASFCCTTISWQLCCGLSDSTVCKMLRYSCAPLFSLQRHHRRQGSICKILNLIFC